jgi:hypothetical protein
MRMMAILLGSAAFVYFVTGIKGRFTRMTRLYFALGTYILVYLITMILVFLGGDL